MEQGWDQDVKAFFIRIINAIALVLGWAFFALTAGLYFELADFSRQPLWLSLLFYMVLAFSFGLLVRYLRRVWKKK